MLRKVTKELGGLRFPPNPHKRFLIGSYLFLISSYHRNKMLQGSRFPPNPRKRFLIGFYCGNRHPLAPLNLLFSSQKCYKVADSSPAPPSKRFLIGFFVPEALFNPKTAVFKQKKQKCCQGCKKRPCLKWSFK